MNSRELKIIRPLGVFFLLTFLIMIPGYSAADEVTAFYPNPNDPGESLQGMFDRLCSEAAAFDTLSILIAPGEYHEPIFTLCNKPVNVNLIGSGIGSTKFISGKTYYHGIQSDRQFSSWIHCGRAFGLERPDGTDACPPAGSPGHFRELCEEMVKVVGPFTPYETSCTVRDLSVVGGGPTATFGIGGIWAKVEIADVEVSGFANDIVVVNVESPEIHHSKVVCPTKTVTDATRQPWGVLAFINLNSLPPSARISDANIHHVDASNCGVGMNLQRLNGGTVSHNKVSDSLNGINETVSEGTEFSHNRIVRSVDQSSPAFMPGWGIGLGDVHDASILHNQFYNNRRAIAFSNDFPACTDITIEDNLDFGNTEFVVDMPPPDAGFTEEGTVDPLGSPQGW